MYRTFSTKFRNMGNRNETLLHLSLGIQYDSLTSAGELNLEMFGGKRKNVAPLINTMYLICKWSDAASDMTSCSFYPMINLVIRE